MKWTMEECEAFWKDEVQQLRTQLAAAQAAVEWSTYSEDQKTITELRTQLAAMQAAIKEHNKHNQNPECYRIKLDGTDALDAAIAEAVEKERERLTRVSADEPSYEQAIAEATKPLVDALVKAADTFADLKIGLRLLGKLDVAKACEIAEEETRKVIPK